MATKPSPQFTPVPVRPRHDGWTPERQVAFIEALAQCGCVDEACDRVGMGRRRQGARKRQRGQDSSELCARHRKDPKAPLNP